MSFQVEGTALQALSQRVGGMPEPSANTPSDVLLANWNGVLVAAESLSNGFSPVSDYDLSVPGIHKQFGDNKTIANVDPFDQAVFSLSSTDSNTLYATTGMNACIACASISEAGDVTISHLTIASNVNEWMSWFTENAPPGSKVVLAGGMIGKSESLKSQLISQLSRAGYSIIDSSDTLGDSSTVRDIVITHEGNLWIGSHQVDSDDRADWRQVEI